MKGLFTQKTPLSNKSMQNINKLKKTSIQR
ncbi:Uncharacterised protein [Vibrio cholerae]|nr:Uncharacterised protein [Vibrio cholerae]